MNGIIANSIICLIDTILLYMYVGSFSHKRDLNILIKVLIFLLIIIFYSICTIFNIETSTLKIPIFILIDIIFCFFLFNDKLYKYVINVSLYYILFSIIEALALTIINLFTEIDATQIPKNYDSVILFILLAIRFTTFIIILFIKILTGRTIFQMKWQVFLLMPILTISFIWFIYNRYLGIGNSDVNVLLAYISLFLIIQNIFVFLYIISLQNSTKQYNEIKDAYNRQKQYSTTITAIQKAVRKMAHDIRHHFIYLRSALDQEDISKAKSYLNQLDENLENIIPLNVTGHYDVDALLHAKSSIAEKLDIHIRVEGTLPPELMISPIDLSALLGNSVDNAIESASRIEGKKEITIAFYYNASRLNYTISNPYNGQLQRKPDGYFVSQKGSGLGFEIMDEVVKKYGGALLTENDDKYFKLTVMLQTPQP